MENLAISFSSFITARVLSPLVDHFKSKGIEITVDELLKILELKNPSPVIVSASGASTEVKVKTKTRRIGCDDSSQQCSYVFRKGGHQEQRCTHSCVIDDGISYPFCRQCIKKVTAQRYLTEKGLKIPPWAKESKEKVAKTSKIEDIAPSKIGTGLFMNASLPETMKTSEPPSLQVKKIEEMPGWSYTLTEPHFMVTVPNETTILCHGVIEDLTKPQNFRPLKEEEKKIVIDMGLSYASNETTKKEDEIVAIPEV